MERECVIFDKKKVGKQVWEHYTETYDYFQKLHDAGYLSDTI
ncbi:hypothetical protein MTBBW1_420018 [Desulfamplus magnetovallimortis]|uniref:Uncharacterized protein n=1 Tax=Desulfamplus magnetovallimortis TaxID=1246637 RepID=A0A1W1HH46_9BACT|nr:hypothetical protein MTBBW1_420018 [Desulfamplus magnetovallimortis]